MIIQDEFFIGNRPFVHTYSDQGYKLLQVETGDVYDEAKDIVGSNYTYQEIEGEYTTEYCLDHHRDFPEMEFILEADDPKYAMLMED